MKNSKQSKELSDKIERLNDYYDDLTLHLDLLQYKPILREELLKVLDKAKAWDIFKAKCSKGAKVACSNLSKKERIERARQAGNANAKRIEKEKQRKHQNQINKHRI